MEKYQEFRYGYMPISILYYIIFHISFIEFHREPLWTKTLMEF